MVTIAWASASLHVKMLILQVGGRCPCDRKVDEESRALACVAQRPFLGITYLLPVDVTFLEWVAPDVHFVGINLDSSIFEGLAGISSALWSHPIQRPWSPLAGGTAVLCSEPAALVSPAASFPWVGLQDPCNCRLGCTSPCLVGRV